MRIFACALLSAWATLSQASTAATDYTDTWWIAQESGWGANVSQQNDTMFVTLFVYDGQNQPQWMVAPSVVLQADGTFKGTLFQTTGTWYVAGFKPAQVTTLNVGTVTFAPSTFSSATLTWTVGGFRIVKDVVRQSWKSDDLTGTYIGGRQGRWAGCGPSLDGRVDSPSVIGVTQTGTDVVIRDAGHGYTCVYNGKAQQAGRMMEIVGNGVCDDHVNRFLDATEVYVSREAFSMKYHMQEIGTECVFTGYAGGVREIQ